MQKAIKISPSIMCCKLWEVEPHIRLFEEAGLDSIHFDVMDGHYVRNIMLGTNYYSSIKELTKLPVDLHLMCLEPERFIEYFKPQEGDRVCFHPETTSHPYRLLQELRAKGVKAGLALNPGTPVELLREYKGVLDYVLVMTVNPGFAAQTLVPDGIEKIRRVAVLLQECGMEAADIFVDGNTTYENTVKMVAAGANGLVAGTASLMKGLEGFMERYREYLSLAQAAQL